MTFWKVKKYYIPLALQKKEDKIQTISESLTCVYLHRFRKTQSGLNAPGDKPST